MADILAVLLDMRGGAVVADINGDFEALVKAVSETGKKGSIGITIEVTPSRFKGERVMEVELSHKIAMHKPKPNFGKAIFFVSEDGSELSRTDPSQLPMEFEAERSK